MSDHLVSPSPSCRVALTDERRHHLLEQGRLALGGDPERAQVPRLQTESAHLGHRLGHDQGVAVVVVAPLAARQQAVLLQLLELDPAEPRGGPRIPAGLADADGLPAAEAVARDLTEERRSRTELLTAAGLSGVELEQLEQYGLLASREGSDHYD